MARTPLAQAQPDVLYDGLDTGLRYLGHDKVSPYGFILFTDTAPEGKSFQFDFAPQSIEQDEEAAVVITPTQGGGKFIEHQGNIFKDINISGTTGFLPLKSTGLLQQGRGVGASDVATQTALAKGSGYNAFRTLRSLFREYWQIHQIGSVLARERTFIYWLNGKDDEVWLVEPMSFRMSRASRSPMAYNYSIRLRTIRKGSGISFPPDPSSLTKRSAGVVGGLIEIRNRIDAASALLTKSLKVFGQYRQLVSLVVSILDVGTTISGQLTTVASGVASVIDTPRTVLTAATTNIALVFDGILAAADLLIAAPLDAYEGLTSMKQQFDFLVAKPALFEKKWGDRWATATENFNDTYGIDGSIDEKDPVKAGKKNDALGESSMSSGESMHQFALRVTGDAARFGEIIVLNNLRWPYTSPSPEERAPGTVAPGDVVLVPTTAASADGNENSTTTKPRTTERTTKDEVLTASTTSITKAGTGNWRVNSWVGFTVELVDGPLAGVQRLITANTANTLTVSPAWASAPLTGNVFRVSFLRVTPPPRGGLTDLLGVDLLLTYSSLLKTWDLVRSGSGDLATVRGEANFNQALTVKFLTTQGELPLHPWFGLRPVFGGRGTPAALFKMRLFFEQTLLSDSRVDSVEHLAITQEGDTYRAEAKLAVKGGGRSRFSSPLV